LYPQGARELIGWNEDGKVQKAQPIIDNARKAVDNKVKKQWKEICTDLRKAFRQRKKRPRLEALRG